MLTISKYLTCVLFGHFLQQKLHCTGKVPAEGSGLLIEAKSGTSELLNVQQESPGVPGISIWRGAIATKCFVLI